MHSVDIVAPSDRQEIVISRLFDAPRAVLFSLLTDPDSIPRWWGPSRLSTVVQHMEPRAGGTWRFVQRDANGQEFSFRGVYHEVSPERIIQTFEFEPIAGHVSLETLTLEEVDGKTRYTTRSVFQTLEDRDAVIQSGMESGARETLDRLDSELNGRLSRA